jgi:LysM repeat protein
MKTKHYLWGLFLLLILFVDARAQEPVNAAVLEYISAYRDLAIREMQRSGVPASIKLAQGILETEAGRSDLVMRSNNHFGIKCKSSWSGERVYHDDDERGECFRKYGAPEDSWKDHSDFLRSQPRYAALFTLDPLDYKSWAYGLKKAGYATNPKYPQILIKYIETYNLNDYSSIALGKMPPLDDMAVNSQAVSIDQVAVSGPNAQPASAPSDPVAATAARTKESFPAGEFRINNTKVIFAEAGTSLLALASEKDIRLKWLLDFNDLPEETDVLSRGQLIFLQRKRKHGSQEFREVSQGENLYDICQSEGIRLESLMHYNHLSPGMQPAPGTTLFLQGKAPERPMLTTTPSPMTSLSEPVALVSAEAPAKALREIRHVVQAKETLFSLAKKYSVGQDQIREWNGLAGSDLKVGQELVIFK